MTLPEFLYYIGYSLDKRYKLKRQKRLPHKVISIGNITAGGTGKTPAAIAVAEEAKRRGFYPVILTRGYKGKAKGPCFVQKSEIKNDSSLLYGDEPVLMSEILKDVLIVKCADRYKGGMFAIKNLKFQISNFKSQIVFILDDGFQHWQLFRDKNILLIDAENPFDNRRLLPVGLLREPLKEIERADIIVLTKTGDIRQAMIEDIVGEIKSYNSKAPLFLSMHKPSGFVKLSGETMPLEWAKEGLFSFFAFCGIGSPESFRKTVLSTGCSLKGLKKYSDHYTYKQEDIEDIIKEAKAGNAGWIVTTEKDLVRLRGLRLPENLVALTIRFAIDEKFYAEVFKC
ncbi:MAG: tetraacyldisaccharide 4'-kinase [Nitrospirae bacterium]|nr:tetraacyldisaccharide 4'-kinase [Nitrospirota bacterium]MBI3376901.1 tetraacyldisaccharide 4'-kinase [Nitrospirota bacterium]